MTFMAVILMVFAYFAGMHGHGLPAGILGMLSIICMIEVYTHGGKR